MVGRNGDCVANQHAQQLDLAVERLSISYSSLSVFDMQGLRETVEVWIWRALLLGNREGISSCWDMRRARHGFLDYESKIFSKLGCKSLPYECPESSLE